jgi:hypothetical protein
MHNALLAALLSIEAWQTGRPGAFLERMHALIAAGPKAEVAVAVVPLD